MTKGKDLKRVVRSRMNKTGEAYTTARMHILRKNESNGTRKRDLAALAGMTDEAVRTKTGRSWAEWIDLLDAFGAARKPHREIAAHLRETYELSGWWSQTVTVGYERIRGLREVGQRRGGSFEVTKTKTFPVPLGRLYRAFSVARTRNRWLTGIDLELRTSRTEKVMRFECGDGTSVEVRFTAKGEGKSSVNVQHRGLATKSRADQTRELWRERLDALGAILR